MKKNWYTTWIVVIMLLIALVLDLIFIEHIPVFGSCHETVCPSPSVVMVLTTSEDEIIEPVKYDAQIPTEVVTSATASATMKSGSYYELTDKERRDFAALVYLESGSETYECKCAVASVILNRMTTQNKSLYDVVYAKSQFTPARKIPYTQPTAEELNAVDEVLTNGPTIPEYVTYFRADHYFSWATPYKNIGRTYFSYDSKIRDQVEFSK